nr:VOC family protein [Pedobacter sp. ASV2]
MIKSLWINLPVKDINKSKDFFTQLGFKLNLQYGSREDSACFLIGESNFVVMLFEENLFKSLINSDVPDAKLGSEVMFSIDAESPEEVNEIAKRVTAAGGTVFSEPQESQGWMYGCAFQDLDGHRWNVLYMDMTKMPLG